MIYILLYFLAIILVILSLYRKFRVKPDDFLVYSRNGNEVEISMSIVALVFGASSVFGLAGWAYKIGWNSIWWTLSGVIFLIILGITFVNVVYSFKGFTIIDIIQSNFGKEIKIISSVILFIAWISVLSGQIIAGGNITQTIVDNRIISICIFSMIFGLYTIIWGQVGAIKTSVFQVVLMVLGLLIIFLISISKINYDFEVLRKAEIGFDKNFTFDLWLVVFISVGLSYLFGPDIYTRIFSSKDTET
ncbi:MAG: sodium:solute symporter family transporter, partial [Brevinematia bacterium]